MRRSPKLQCKPGRPALGSSRPRLRTPASVGHPSQSSTGRDTGHCSSDTTGWARCVRRSSGPRSVMRAGSHSSDQVVRFAGLDVTVYSSDGKRCPGHLSHQGSPALRWAAFEAAKCAARPGSPDYAYYHQVAERTRGNKQTSGKNPTLAVERQLLRRCYHTLRALGDAALAIPRRGGEGRLNALCVPCPHSRDARGQLPNSHCRHPSPGGRPGKTERPHPRQPARRAPHPHHVAGPRPRTQISLGAGTPNRGLAPPTSHRRRQHMT